MTKWKKDEMAFDSTSLNRLLAAFLVDFFSDQDPFKAGFERSFDYQTFAIHDGLFERFKGWEIL